MLLMKTVTNFHKVSIRFKSLQVFIFELCFGELVIVFNLKFLSLGLCENMILEGLVHV
jgi:hypothetical protein